MRFLRSPYVVLLLALPLVALVLLITSDPAPEGPQAPKDAPKVVVALGDSAMSGEGAGDYEPGTNGENGNWCHRSPKALIHQTWLPELHTAINLACSGARSEHLLTQERFTESPQISRLDKIARNYRVAAIVVQVGANDDPGFTSVVKQCAEAWIKGRQSGCSEQLKLSWSQRVDAMVPKVSQVLREIRATMSKAGYVPASYQLVVQSYAAPVGKSMTASLRNLSGCPFQSNDLEWVQDKAIGELAAGIRTAAARNSARFLDLSRAAVGKEACSAGSAANEWFTRLTINWNDIRDELRSAHAMQESFHPNATGHAQFGSCLSQFLATQDQAAACLPGPDQNLRPMPGAAIEARAPR